MKKKFLAVALVGVLAISALTACGANNNNTGDVIITETDTDSNGNTNSVALVLDPTESVEAIADTLGMGGVAVDAADFFDIPDGVEGAYYMGSKTTCDSIGFFSCPNSDSVGEVADVVDMFLANQKEEFQRYMADEVYKFDDIYTYQDDNIYIFVLNGDKAAASDAVDSLFK